MKLNLQSLPDVHISMFFFQMTSWKRRQNMLFLRSWDCNCEAKYFHGLISFFFPLEKVKQFKCFKDFTFELGRQYELGRQRFGYINIFIPNHVCSARASWNRFLLRSNVCWKAHSCFGLVVLIGFERCFEMVWNNNIYNNIYIYIFKNKCIYIYILIYVYIYIYTDICIQIYIYIHIYIYIYWYMYTFIFLYWYMYTNWFFLNFQFFYIFYCVFFNCFFWNFNIYIYIHI